VARWTDRPHPVEHREPAHDEQEQRGPAGEGDDRRGVGFQSHEAEGSRQHHDEGDGDDHGDHRPEAERQGDGGPAQERAIVGCAVDHVQRGHERADTASGAEDGEHQREGGGQPERGGRRVGGGAQLVGDHGHDRGRHHPLERCHLGRDVGRIRAQAVDGDDAGDGRHEREDGEQRHPTGDDRDVLMNEAIDDTAEREPPHREPASQPVARRFMPGCLGRKRARVAHSR